MERVRILKDQKRERYKPRPRSIIDEDARKERARLQERIAGLYELEMRFKELDPDYDCLDIPLYLRRDLWKD